MYANSSWFSRTINVIAFDYFYQKIMYTIDCKKLLNALVLISNEEGDMATRARDIHIELVTQKAMLMNENRDLSVLMIAKKIAHSFMLNRNFDLIQGETFDLWDDSIKQAKYKFLYRPEYVFRLSFVYTMGENRVLVALERILKEDVKPTCGILKNLPELTDISVANDEYRIEQLLLHLARTFSVL